MNDVRARAVSVEGFHHMHKVFPGVLYGAGYSMCLKLNLLLIRA